LAPVGGTAGGICSRAALAALPRSLGNGQPTRGTSASHGGADAQDTQWLSFPAPNPPAWLSPYGGTLAKAFQVLAAT